LGVRSGSENETAGTRRVMANAARPSNTITTGGGIFVSSQCIVAVDDMFPQRVCSELPDASAMTLGQSTNLISTPT
ncbi:hypothetical protein, partial [Xanthomonas oryzae]|uniref:hypothetical protein n=1 Tax=Xanthomonas oryzae TaxID=347 RepID=UPI001E5F0112